MKSSKVLKSLSGSNSRFNGITIGEVVDTNDPQNMGRLRVMCPALGDTPDKKIEDFPWAVYASPFGGSSDIGTRGSSTEDTHTSTGGVAYGMWSIPNVGAHVLICCVDGDTDFRVWMGCIQIPASSGTLPHGRYKVKNGTMDGPFTNAGNPIQPLYDNLRAQHGDPKSSMEFLTRGADYQAGRVSKDQLSQTHLSEPDDNNTSLSLPDGTTRNITQGYGTSRVEPSLTSGVTGANYDSHVYSITTPGFHAISMDDRPENCRIRIRTTHGSQILIDDSNERIYINTAQGNNWVELDECGNIDIYSARRVSIRAAMDVNITSEESIRLHGKQIHMVATEGIRMSAGQDVDIKTATALNMQSGDDTSIGAGGNVLITGTQIHENGPPANPAKSAYYPNRVPNHEPWARVVMKKSGDNDATPSQTPEYDYNSPKVNRVEQGEDLERNEEWKR